MGFLISILFLVFNNNQFFNVDFNNVNFGVLGTKNEQEIYTPAKKQDLNIVLSAKSAVAIDLETNTVLFEKNTTQKLYPASLTKLTTALVALPKLDLEKEVTINSLETKVTQEDFSFVEGEKVKTKDLLSAMLIASSNQAAYALARESYGSVEAFTVAQNMFLKDNNINNTKYTNPAGFDNGGPYSTALDQSKILSLALNNELLMQILATNEFSFKTNLKNVTIKNTNEILNNSEIFGGKTGTTRKAGECLAVEVSRETHKIIVVVMGSNDRYGDVEKIINGVYENYEWEKIKY